MDDQELTASENAANDAPLSMSEAIKAFTAPEPEQEADTGQSEADAAPEGEHAEDELPPDEVGEDEGEPADEEQAEDGDEEVEPESDQGRFVADNAKVRLEDGTITSIAELKKGTLLHADYTRKTQEVAEARKATEAQSQRVQQKDTELEQQREYVVSLVKSILPPQPDPRKANPADPMYDPAGYQAEEVAYRQWASHLTYLDTEQQRAAQERQAKTTEETKARVEKEWNAALEKLPELKDAKRLEAFGKDTLKYGAEYGYTPQELATIHHDHRQLHVMKDAIAFRKLQAQKLKNPVPKDNGRPPVLKGGTRLNPGANKAREANAAMERLNKSGSLRDGVAAFLATQSKR